MIFATVGTQLPFDRLLHAVDTWAGAHAEVKVIAQIGETEQVFAHMTCRESIAQDEFREMFEQAEVIVGHAGMGTILTASELGKPVVIMPRLARHGEHRTDHQLATTAEMSRLGNVFVANGPENVAAQIDAALAAAGDMGQTLGTDASPELVQALQKCVRSAVAHRKGLELSGLPPVDSVELG